MSTPSETLIPEPSPLDFEKYLPWACKQLQLSINIMVIRLQQDEYVRRPLNGAPDRSHKAKPKVESITEVTEDASVKTVATHSSNFAEDEIIRIFTVFDIYDHVLHIKFDNNKEIPRKVLKLLELIVHFHIYLTKITIIRTVDYVTVHELNKLLALSNITDICIYNVAKPVVNYDILIEKENRLRQLTLSRCKIDDKLVKKIASKLSYPFPASKTLHVLNLSMNRITDNGAKYLAETLRTNRELMYLNLADNSITDEGATVLLEVLNEFPLTDEEKIRSKERYLKYLKEKSKLISQILLQLRAVDYDKKIDKKRKAMRAASMTPNQLPRKIKPIERETSLKRLESIPTIETNHMWFEKAKKAAESRLGNTTDPFSPALLYNKNDQIYCKGNYDLADLNLSFNQLTYFTVKKLLAVLVNQTMSDRKPRGLINVTIEGNRFPVACKELCEIDAILDTNLKLITKRQSLTKMKRRQS